MSGQQRSIWVAGGSGFAREMRALFRVVHGNAEFHFISDADERAFLASASGLDALLAIGHPRLRLEVYQRWTQAGVNFVGLCHPAAVTDATCTIGTGSLICAGAIISCDVEVADAVVVNWNATIGHDCRIGLGTVINPNASVSGGCKVGAGTLIGAGATILEGIVVGDFARVGAGAVVTRNVRAGETVVGVPARSFESTNTDALRS